MLQPLSQMGGIQHEAMSNNVQYPLYATHSLLSVVPFMFLDTTTKFMLEALVDTIGHVG